MPDPIPVALVCTRTCAANRNDCRKRSRASVLLIAVTLAVFSVSSLAAAPLPAEREGRLIDTLHGITLEYSPGHEAYVAPLAEAVAAWRVDLAAQRKEHNADPLPLSAADLLANRDAVLREIAAAVGLDQPTELQAACYDTFLNYYLAFAELHGLQQRMTFEVAGATEMALWRKAELLERLQHGEHIEGFTYDPAKDELQFSFGFSTPGNGGEGNAAKAMEATRLDHAFHYEVKDGIAHLGGSFSFRPGEQRAAGIHFDPVQFREQVDREIRNLRLILPVRMEKEGVLLSPEEVVAAELTSRREFAEESLKAPYRNGGLAMIVMHETAELGLIERYIGSGDRRWLCDGTANYVAWSIARRRAGEAFAKEVYDLPAQLAQHEKLQRKIRLSRWPAVERQPEEDRKTPLDRARYAFATRAVVRMAEQHGDDFVAKLWCEVGKTPRQKVSMKTVESAYRKLTGDRLSSVIRYAEKTRIATTPAP